MPLKPFINVKCPCCHRILEINVEKERVIAHRKGKHLKEDAKEGEDGMDVALRQHHDSGGALEEEFLKAAQKERDRSKTLDEMFKEAQKKAGELGPEDPNDPFKGGKIWD